MKKKIRVLRVIARLNTGGPAIHVTLLERLLSNEDYKSCLYTGKVSEGEGSMEELASMIDLRKSKFFGRDISLLKDILAAIELFFLIRKFQPHIVHTHTAKAGVLGRIAAILNGVPFVYHTFHGHLFRGYYSEFKTDIIKRIERFLGRFTTKIITLSETLVKEISDDHKIASREKFQIIPLGFAFENLSITEASGLIRERYNTDMKDFVFGIIARLVPIKNHKMLLEALKKVVDQKTKCKPVLWIVGEGELSQELRDLVKTLSVEENVRFLGWHKQLGSIYKALDIVTLSSKNEGLPVTIIEGLAMGKKVIAPIIGGIPDIMTDSEDGYLFEVDSVDGLAECMLIAIENGKTGISGKRRKHIRRRYSVRNLVKNIESLYYSGIRKDLGNLKI